MKKLFLLISFFILAGCSSADLALSDLKEDYPQSFAEPIDSLSKNKQEKIGLPGEIPFEVTSVSANTSESKVEIIYQSDQSDSRVTVRTIFQPDNILKETDLQVQLNSGATAGVLTEEDSVFVEWYNGEADVIYQIEYQYKSSEEPQVEAIEIANSI